MEKDKQENLDYNFSGINTMNIDWCLDTEFIFDMPILKKLKLYQIEISKSFYKFSY